jgi:hypothetical protein
MPQKPLIDPTPRLQKSMQDKTLAGFMQQLVTDNLSITAHSEAEHRRTRQADD